MYQMLVAVFDTETATFEGLSALKDLHRKAASRSMRRPSS
jgi:hypothetical protein